MWSKCFRFQHESYLFKNIFPPSLYTSLNLQGTRQMLSDFWFWQIFTWNFTSGKQQTSLAEEQDRKSNNDKQLAVLQKVVLAHPPQKNRIINAAVAFAASQVTQIKAWWKDKEVWRGQHPISKGSQHKFRKIILFSVKVVFKKKNDDIFFSNLSWLINRQTCPWEKMGCRGWVGASVASKPLQEWSRHHALMFIKVRGWRWCHKVPHLQHKSQLKCCKCTLRAFAIF